MNIKFSAILNVIFLVVITGLIYMGVAQHRVIATKDNLLTASLDSNHHFKTSIGSIGVYTKTLEGDKKDLIALLESRDSTNKVLADSLKKDKNIRQIATIQTKTNTTVEHKIDTLYKSVVFEDSISSKFYRVGIKVKEGVSKWSINTTDALTLTNTTKRNKGLFTGSTLTTYATSSNPNETITGVTSISVPINQPKVKVRPAIGVGLNSDLHGNNIRLGYNAGVVITF